MTIENEFASVVVVALDGQPISSSTDLLIQAMTEATNRGWASAGSPQKTIESIGESPIVVRDIRGTVELPQREAAIVRVTALDDNGYPLESLVGNGFRLWPKSEYFHVQVLPCASASTLASSQAAPPCRPASAQ
jgi:hypothetical protein